MKFYIGWKIKGERNGSLGEDKVKTRNKAKRHKRIEHLEI
jgi:hypothetical protein